MSIIQIKDDIEIYQNDIFRLIDDYISFLNIEDENLLCDVSMFDGLIDYIYIHKFKPSVTDKVKNNTRTNISLDNINLLNDLFDIYCLICAKYRQTVTILRFCRMIGISRDTLNSWERCEYRNATSLHSDSVKNWLERCNSSLESKASTGNVGAIFLLKSNFKYRDNETIMQDTSIEQKPISTPEEIAERYKGAALPEKPVFD